MSLKDVLLPFLAWGKVFKNPVTVKDPFNDRPGAARYRGFHKNDIETCIGCGACEEICQNAAIDMVPVKGIETKDGDSGLRPMVDYGRCCWCALCVDVCSTNSLNLSNEYTWIENDPDKFRYIPGVDKKDWDNNELGWKKPENYDLNEPFRIQMEELKPEKRDSSFIEFVKGYSKEQAEAEADRCIDCGLCTATCPAHMAIPEYIKAIRNDDLEEGLRLMYETNPLPEICGRICTHKCETVCAMGHKGDALSIRWLKRYIADQIPPAGLSAAYYLANLGYKTKIFEALPEAGGMMRYGIPEYRLPYDQIDKDVKYILSLGVEIEYNVKIGKDISLEELGKEYDAVFAGTGLHLGRSTRIPGAEHENVYFATDLLREISLGKDIHVGNKIVVIGGGNVAMDITRSLIRLQNQKNIKVDVHAC